jgi:cell division protein FtsQ
MNIIDDPSTRRAILKKQTVRREKVSVFSRIWKVMIFSFSCFFKFSCLVLILGVISLLFVSVYGYLLRSPYIKLDRVVVTGVDEDLRSDLLEMSELDFDMSLLAINVGQVKEKLENHPWIRSVTVEKQFPHTLAIRAEKEEPWAIAVKDRLAYMNRWGKIFKDVDEGDPLDFPIVTGFPASGEDTGSILNTAVLVLSTLESEKGAWSLKELSEIHVRGDGSVYLYYESLPAGIKVKASELGKRIEDLKRVVDHLNRSGRIRTAKSINLEYADGAVVSFKKG